MNFGPRQQSKSRTNEAACLAAFEAGQVLALYAVDLEAAEARWRQILPDAMIERMGGGYLRISRKVSHETAARLTDASLFTVCKL